jgi:hypothetical protein
VGLSTSTTSGSSRPFLVAACVCALWFLLEIAALAGLTSTCAGDDETVPGCSHY